MANIIYDLGSTRFRVRLEEYPDYIFFFSSVFHQNKFLKGYKNFIKTENSIKYIFGYGEISQIIFYLSENFVTKIQVKQSI